MAPTLTLFKATTSLALVATLALGACGDDDQGKQTRLDVADTSSAETVAETTTAPETNDETTCVPLDCAALQAECGTPDNGCGTPLACGTCSRDHAVGTCDAAAYTCTFACDSGFHACGDLCAANDDITHCGATCEVCSAPASPLEIATCDGTQCQVACAATATDCSGVCVDLATDKDHCGACDAAPCDGKCIDRQCVPDYTVSLVSGDAQEATFNNTVPQLVMVKVVDTAGANAGSVKLYIAPSPGAAASQLEITTASTGVATFRPRVGRGLGEYTYKIGLVPSGAGGVTVKATAKAPAADSVFPLVNLEHVSADGPIPGPGSLAGIQRTAGIAYAPDGTVYFVGGQRVLALAPSGALSAFAGTPNGGSGGDQGPALEAGLSGPTGLALDEANGLLFIADTSNHRVRAVDIARGTITTWAGGGSATDANFGDDGPAAGAVLSGPDALTIGPDGALYLFDHGHSRVRRVDPLTTIITTILATGGTGCLPGDPLRFTGYGQEMPMAWDPAGQLFLGGSIACGDSGGNGNGPLPGVVRRAADGTLHRVAGFANGTTSDGATGLALSVSNVWGLAFDPGGNLYIAEGDRIRRIDTATGIATTVIGGASAGGSGDFGAASAAQVSKPVDMVIAPTGELIFADSTNRSLRSIWALSGTSEGAATLAITGGNTQTVFVDQAFLPFTVKVTDAAAKGLAGAHVLFAENEPGSSLADDIVTTGATGVAAVTGRVGLSLGDYTFSAESRDIHGEHITGSPATFTVTAQAPAAGTIFTAVNVDHTAGTARDLGPGTTSRLPATQLIATSSTGMIYFTAAPSVWSLDPDGVLERVAGKGSGFGGDFGAAKDAEFYNPRGLALDEVDDILYVADTNNHRIRAINLATGIITTFAGGGDALGPNFGDDQAATSAVLAGPVHITIFGRDLFIGDEGHNRIRKVSLDTGIISNFVSMFGASPNCAAQPSVIPIGGYSLTFPLAFDATGRLYFGSSIACGDSGGNGNGPLHGITRRELDGTFTRITGKAGGTTTDGAPATASAIAGAVALALDGNRLYVTIGHAVKVIDVVNDTITTVVGNGSVGAGTDYVLATATQLSTPNGLAFAPGGHLIVADQNHYALRWVWAPLP